MSDEKTYNLGECLPDANATDTEYIYPEYIDGKYPIFMEDLEIVNSVRTVEFNKKGEEGKYKRIALKRNDGKEIIIPPIVYSGIRACLEEYGVDKLKGFNIKKTGDGKTTRYNVLPLI